MSFFIPNHCPIILTSATVYGNEIANTIISGMANHAMALIIFVLLTSELIRYSVTINGI